MKSWERGLSTCWEEIGIGLKSTLKWVLQDFTTGDEECSEALMGFIWLPYSNKNPTGKTCKIHKQYWWFLKTVSKKGWQVLKYLFEVIVNTYYFFLKIVLNQVSLNLLVSEYNSTYESYINIKVGPAFPLTFHPQIFIEPWIQRQGRRICLSF